MRRQTAKHILDSLLGVNSSSQAPLRIEPIAKSDVVWRHPWNINKKHRVGGVRARRLLPDSDGQPDALALVFLEWSPKFKPGDYYLVLLNESGRGSPLAEIHLVESAGGSMCVEWFYVPRKKDRFNKDRKAVFVEAYPEGSVRIGIPRSEKETPAFVAGLFDLAWARLAADQLVVPPISVSIPLDEETLSFEEGKPRRRYILHRSRERRLRAEKIKKALQVNGGRLACEVPGCEFDFRKAYGALGAGFAHVHHLKPLAKAGQGMKVSLAELAIVCANCHSMIHKGGQCREMKGLIKAVG